MDALLRTIRRVWPQACWSISHYGDNKYTGYVSNGKLFGRRDFVSGIVDSKDPVDALVKAFKEALHKEYELHNKVK